MVFSAHVVDDEKSTAPRVGVNASETNPDGSGGGDVQLSGRVDTQAKIRVNILAATDDGGLIAEISEEGRDRNAPLTRVGITKDGQVLALDKQVALYDEETGLLMLLARDFVAAHDPASGSAWTLPFGSGADKLNVKVTAIENGRLALSLHGEAGDESRGESKLLNGTVLYDRAHTTPVEAELISDTRTLAGAENATANMTIDYALESDSLGGM